MVRIGTFFLLVSAALFGSVAAQVENDNPSGKTLYVNYPSCDSYKCQVIWRPGQNVYVNWLKAPKGSLKIELMPQEGTTGLKTYTVTDKVGGVHNKNTCNNMGTKEKCGRFDWTVPSNVKPGQYMIVVTSLTTGQQGYTDTVVIKKKKN
ncbi:hypothetical protein BCV70DRAFT_107176 [Testicularia cyperi]|uniref:Uncharacterized protein n=1 Tax=Testicularia cyperi TaxID=1882483 RepID=A0A317XPE1_9BASI|nr:hypothetical protein BCV70DRAFT_107176 [Testicularia cyperi]